MGQILFAPAGAGVTSDDVTATKAQVLSGYTALTSDSDDEAASGSMTNNGAWTSSSSGSGKITIPAGYHNGSGYVDCTGAYNKGVTDADNRTNSNSANYKAGYNKGVTDADNRTNSNSANYKAGYNSGYTNGHQTFRSSGTLWAVAASRGMNSINCYSNCFNSSIVITVEKESNAVVSYSCIDTTSTINDVINGQLGVIINGTDHTYGWNNRSSFSYSGKIPANSTVKFYVNCGVNDGLRMGMNYSLTIY